MGEIRCADKKKKSVQKVYRVMSFTAQATHTISNNKSKKHQDASYARQGPKPLNDTHQVK